HSQLFIRFPQSFQSLLRCLQCFVTKIECASVMRLQNEKPDYHWVICFLQCRMISAEKFGELDNIVIALPHLLAVNCDHIIMYPITDRSYMIANCTLCDLAFM